MSDLHHQLNLYYLYLMLDIRSFVGQSPRLFGLVQKLSRTRRIHNLVERNSGICIDAPSGSGNSYFVKGFRKKKIRCNGENCRQGNNNSISFRLKFSRKGNHVVFY